MNCGSVVPSPWSVERSGCRGGCSSEAVGLGEPVPLSGRRTRQVRGNKPTFKNGATPHPGHYLATAGLTAEQEKRFYFGSRKTLRIYSAFMVAEREP